MGGHASYWVECVSELPLPGVGCSLRSQGHPLLTFSTVHRTLEIADHATGSQPRGGLLASLPRPPVDLLFEHPAKALRAANFRPRGGLLPLRADRRPLIAFQIIHRMFKMAHCATANQPLLGFKRPELHPDDKKTGGHCPPVFCGLGEKIRTSGLLNPIQARYQTALHPVALTLMYFSTAKGACQ